jgi:hypothetical protein
MTMSMPYDSAAGRLFYWSRQGISLAALQELVDQALANAGQSPGGGSLDPAELLELQQLIATAQSTANAAASTATTAAGTANVASTAASTALAAVSGLATLPGKVVPGTSYTMVAGDDAVELRFTADAAITAVIPSDTTWPCPVGTIVPFAQKGVGVLTWVAEAGVELSSPDSATARRQNSSGMWIKEAANTWRVSGDMVGAVRPSVAATTRIPGNTNVTSGSVAVPIPDVEDRLLIVCVHSAVSAQVSTVTATYGGVPMTPVGTPADSWTTSPVVPQRRVDVFYALAPAVGTATLAVTSNVAAVLDVTATTFRDVNQGTPIGDIVTFSSATAEVNSVTPAAANWNDLVFAAFTGRTTILPTVPTDVDIYQATIKAGDMTVIEAHKQGSNISTITITQANQVDNRSAVIGFIIKGA